DHLTQSYNKAKKQAFIYLLINFKNEGNFTKEILSSGEGLSTQMIAKHFDKWDWTELSGNRYIEWSEELIDRYADKWDWSWRGISLNHSIPWTQSLLKRYSDKLDWYALLDNSSVPWSYELLNI